MKSLIKNWSYLTISDGLNQLFAFLVMIKLARELNPEGYGAFNIVLAISSIFFIFSNFGMTQIIVREISRDIKSSYALIKKFFVIRVSAIALAMIVLVLYFIFFRANAGTLIIICTAVMAFSMTSFDMAESIAFGHQIMKYTSFINVGMLSLWVAFVWLMPKQYYNILNILVVYSALTFLKAAAYYVVLYRLGLLAKDSSHTVRTEKEIVRMCLPYLWLWGIGSLTAQLPFLLLEANSNEFEAGLFAVGMRLILPLTLTVNTSMKALFPTLSKMSVDNELKFRESISKGALFIVFFGTLAAFFITLVSPVLIPLLFDVSYKASVSSFNLLIWFGVIFSLDILLGTALSASDRQNLLALLATIDFLISLPLMYYGSFSGALGLSLMRFISGMIIIIYHWIIFKKILGKSFIVSDWLFMLLFFLPICFLSVESFNINLIIKVALVIAITLIFLLYKNTKFYTIPLIIKKQLSG